MHSIDRVDHVRIKYNVGSGLRQRNWWWPVFLCNSYLICNGWYGIHGLKPMSHYHFCDKTTLSSLNREKYWLTRYSRKPKFKPETATKSSSASRATKRTTTSLMSAAPIIRSIIASLIGSSESTIKSCRIWNQTSLANGSFDKRLILSDEFTNLSAPTMSKYSERQLHKWTEKSKQIA